MIRYLSRGHSPTPPPWLLGADDVAHTMCADGSLFGVGHPALLGSSGPWRDCGEGWACAGSQDPRELRRARLWCDVVDGVDQAGRWWSFPVILDREGRRSIRVAYGKDWLPALTPEQERAEAIAKEARAVLTGGQDPGPQVGCQWTAELLSITHHISPGVCQALHFIDDMLLAQALTIAAGLHDA